MVSAENFNFADSVRDALHEALKERGHVIGEAYIAALEMLFVNNNGEPPMPNEVAEAFKTKYSQLAIAK
ncbi:hypothetical protein [Phormidesmis priestleyi]